MGTFGTFGQKNFRRRKVPKVPFRNFGNFRPKKFFCGAKFLKFPLGTFGTLGTFGPKKIFAVESSQSSLWELLELYESSKSSIWELSRLRRVAEVQSSKSVQILPPPRNQVVFSGSVHFQQIPSFLDFVTTE